MELAHPNFPNFAHVQDGKTNLVWTDGNASAHVKDGVAIAVAENGGRAIAVATLPQPQPVQIQYEQQVQHVAEEQSRSFLGTLIDTTCGCLMSGVKLFFPLFFLPILWSTILIGLIGDTLNNASEGSPPVLKFCFFVVVLSNIISICRLATSLARNSRHTRSVMMIVNDGVATLFIFLGAIILVCKLGVHSCFNDDYIESNKTIPYTNNPKKTCQELQASAFFFWTLFLNTVGFLIYSIYSFRRY